MKLKKLIQNVVVKEVKGSKETEIFGICNNSKVAFPGCLYITKKGLIHDGSQFIAEAVSAGAVAVVTDIYDPFLKNVVQIIHDDPAIIEADIAETFYQTPSKELFVVGITGTNGKTTTAYLIKHIFDALQFPCALLSTIETIFGKKRFFSSLTTSDSLANQKLMREMLNEECKSLVMEVSSHGLLQKRVENISFDVAIFTNFSQDHLDYHQNMQNYLDAKKILFQKLSESSVAILNRDSQVFEEVKKECPCDILTYGIDYKADLQAENIQLSTAGTTCIFSYKEEKQIMQIPLLGKHNVANVLAAAAVALTKGYHLKDIQKAIKSFSKISGRLEKAVTNTPFTVYVDFAHTEEALEKTLICLQEIKKNKVIVVFGCGGGRDFLKRPMMAKICEKYADISIITSDNPRHEDPEKICRDIALGFSSPSYIIELNRGEAIRKAMLMAEENDIILIAGKGHEKKQIFAHQVIDFDDKSFVEDVCKELLPQG